MEALKRRFRPGMAGWETRRREEGKAEVGCCASRLQVVGAPALRPGHCSRQVSQQSHGVRLSIPAAERGGLSQQPNRDLASKQACMVTVMLGGRHFC